MIFRHFESFLWVSKETFLVESFEYIITTLNSQSVVWPKEGLYHRYFKEKSSEMDGCGQLSWTVQAEDFRDNIFGGVILVYSRYFEQSVWNLTKRRTLAPVFSGEIFENRWLWTAASEQSACDVIRFGTIKISFGIAL